MAMNDDKNLRDTYLKQYSDGIEETRLSCSKAANAEFLVTLYYISKYLHPGARVIDIGAGVGAYAKELSHKGYMVDALDLHPINVEKMKSIFKNEKNIKVFQADARDLSAFQENSYDIVLVMGPIYHLHNTEERLRAIEEAVRIAKSGAPIFVAFCLQDAPLIQYIFQSENPALEIGTIGYERETAMVTENKGSSIKLDTLDKVKELIDMACKVLSVTRGPIFSQDGLSNIIRREINKMSEESYHEWIQYLIATAERSDLMGYSNHIVQILIKR